MPGNPILRIAASAELVQRGCVHVIGLDDIKATIGPRWGKLKESVWAHLETLLTQKLGATDFYTQLSETAFLVSMPSSRQDEAQIFCLRAAHDLHASLLGRCDAGKLQIAVVTDVWEETVQTVAIAGEKLNDLASLAGLEGAGGGNTSLSTPKTDPCIPLRCHFQHRFEPVWDAQKEALTTYRCVTLPEAGEDASVKTEIAATLARIRFASDGLLRRLQAGDRFILWLPISFHVLSAPAGRMEIATICRSLSSDFRPYIVFEISGLPEGVPQSRLSELVGSLRPFCRGVAAQLPTKMVNYNAYLGAGLIAIGVSLSNCTAVEMLREISELDKAAQKQHLVSFVLDMTREDTVHYARGRGVNLLSGPLIGAALNAPLPIRRLSAREIAREQSARFAAA